MVVAVLLGGFCASRRLAVIVAITFRNNPVRPGDQATTGATALMVRRIIDGDRTAEAEFVARYARGVRMIVSRASSDRSAVDDLCQETFKTALEKVRRGDVRDPERLSGFICGLARNLVVDYFRRAARTSVGIVPDRPDPSPDPLDQLLARERAASARAVLAELGSERDRQILLRFYVAGDSKEDICADFGLSSLHFNRVLFRARERYRVLYRSIAATAEK
jgi:RNA polymerase sigma-70 factor (ECF subfamily)